MIFVYSHERGYCSRFICNHPHATNHSPNEIANYICMCIIHFIVFFKDAGDKISQMSTGLIVKYNFKFSFLFHKIYF